MITINAKTLKDAYIQACKELDASIVDIHFEVVQTHFSGLLGLFKKDAIILAELKQKKENTKSEDVRVKPPRKVENLKIKEPEQKIEHKVAGKQKAKLEQNDIVDDFYKQNVKKFKNSNIESHVDEIKDKLDLFFLKSCYDIDSIEVYAYDEVTISIDINGNDSSLLIGKGGKRYKAISYMLFNWIKLKYGYFIRLEISQFLETQEKNIKLYIESIEQKIIQKGYGKTKILDGVLVHIAIKELKERFPDKSIRIKDSANGKYIVVNEFGK